MSNRKSSKPISRESVHLTGSKFQGTYDKLGMQGLGLYTYPDGATYVGEFEDNRFHGKGTITLPYPYCVCFDVLHHHGSLEKINSMSFNDKLPVNVDLCDGELSFDNWEYCTHKDRRFAGEMNGPMEAVGPHMYQSREGPNPPELGRNVFDLGFGKYNRLGCVTEMPSHMSEEREFYVGCPEVRSWIQHHCRHGELRGIQLDPIIIAQFTRKILENNLESEKEVVDNSRPEVAFTQLDRTQKFKRSISRETSVSAIEARLRLNSSSESSSTSLAEPMPKNATQKCLCKNENRKIRIEYDPCRIS